MEGMCVNMENEKTKITWKDIFALTIAFFEIALPYTILLILSILFLMLLFTWL